MNKLNKIYEQVVSSNILFVCYCSDERGSELIVNPVVIVRKTTNKIKGNAKYTGKGVIHFSFVCITKCFSGTNLSSRFF